jgi:septal ring factor EnvC (AmiA/AmiB activator)
MKIHTLLVALLFLSLSTGLHAQTNATIRGLETKRSTLQKDIAQKEQILGTTTKNVRTNLRNLSTLTGQIDERKRYIDGIARDMDTINREMRQLRHSLDSLEKQLKARKDKYAKSLQRLYRARQMHEKLMFIFASSSLREAYRRSKYLQD